MQKDPDDGYSMINICPPFMKMRRLRDDDEKDAIHFGANRPKPWRWHLKSYDSTGTWFTKCLASTVILDKQ